ncbi:MAG: hypothetical protein Q6362_010545 [Candidatus Wukongarchaeota archaeon]|nr:hypothetical protein [Candidatus Wukongarchaeota archaeon]MDO8129851.1 hypothetical protein [Candidatus Wukongarchaeota archaeon]
MEKNQLITIALVALFFSVGFITGEYILEDEEEEPAVTWTETFNIEGCNFSATGRNDYFILEPGYQLIFEGEEDGDTVILNITVLDNITMIGGIETRVVVETETLNGELVEISRNFFTICNETNSVFYFGEEVDIYENGVVVSHEGAWIAFSNDAKPGVMMPGIILLGARYYQEIAPGVAEDRAEIISMTETVQTPFGTFENCLKIEETTPLEPGVKEYKYYAAGIGLIQDGDLKLTSLVSI